MSSSGAGYDYSTTTYSVDGRIFQVEYAQKAVENSGTAIGVRCSDGVVVSCESVQPGAMVVPGTVRQTQIIDDHVVSATTGWKPDGRQLVARAREEAHHYHDNFGVDAPTEVLANRVASYSHFFTLHGSLRPFGATMLMAGYDEEKKVHELYMIEPNGDCFRYFGCATGKGRQAAKTEVEKLRLNEITCRDAIKEIAKIHYTLFDESKDKPFDLDMSWISEESGWKAAAVPKAVIDEAVVWAKAKIEEEDDMDDEEEDEDDEGQA